MVEQVDSSDECQTSTQLLNQRAVFTYQLEENAELDCNGNMTEDSCEIADNPLIDCINSNGIIDTCEGLFDCNLNCIPDDLDLVFGNSTDIDFDGILDECDPDDDNDDIPDECDVDQTEGMIVMRTELLTAVKSPSTVTTKTAFRTFASASSILMVMASSGSRIG